MPIYLTSRRGVRVSEAFAEAAVGAPIRRAMLYAYELWHESLSAPIRFVNDKAELTAALEDDAPRNAGETVNFVSCPLSMERPTESDSGGTPGISLSRPDIAGILKGAMDVARGSLEPWQLIERVYASDDLTGPAMLPVLTYELESVSVAGSAAKVVASFDDEDNIAVPRPVFARAQYPGLGR